MAVLKETPETSPWFSFLDPAPCRTSIARHGGGWAGSQSMYGRPAWTPISLGAATSLLIALLKLFIARGVRASTVTMSAPYERDQ